ncbi:uncharacterized protein LOC116308656 [Actinia tenebrosa]|uniref:Uncharacterized protein LOC116308656 n=1 Tax=Actinia tenebrosa TaxID=6105 RepID=A0A6P8JF41_ACTTE|nr:uncharacterized protein LOC116308656 [Actinia tenebrosa]
MDSLIDPFRALLLSIANDCTDEDFTNMKFLCSGCLPEGRLEDISSPRELFIELIHDCIISKDEKQPLASLLFNIGRQDLRNRLLGKESPTLAGAFQHWGGLPMKIPNFVDRKDECQEVLSKLRRGTCKVVMIIGPPGFGKSSVAIQVGHDLCLHGISVYYISLRSCTSMFCMVNYLLGALRIVASEKPIKQAMHCLCNLTTDTVIILDNAEDMLLPPIKDEFCGYIENVAQTAQFVRILVTSRMSMTFLNVDSHVLRLDALERKDAQKLLKTFRSNISDDDSEVLADLCGGVPLVLRTTASLLANEGTVHPKALISEFQRSPVSTLKSFDLLTLSHDHQIFYCLNICFERLSHELQLALISLCVFPTSFTLHDAQFILKEHSEFYLELHLQELINNSLLQFDPVMKEYTMHGVIQAFCKDKTTTKASKYQWKYEFAKKEFNCHYLELLPQLQEQFISKKALAAVENFLAKRRHIRQAMLDAVNDPELEKTCIDTANAVAPFLTKVLRKEKFLTIFQVYTKICKDKEDEKRYSDCLTSEAYCILSHCACHLPCPTAVSRFKEADAIQTKLEDESSTIRSHCLIKLGRCVAHYGDLDKGITLIKRGIGIREKMNDPVQLAVAYKDLAASYSFHKQHHTANRLRVEKVLPVYKQHLGDHAYTATLMDDMGMSCMALSNYDCANTYIKEAVRMRVKALGDHQETARSYHDYGTVLKAQGRYDEALVAIREALRIQENILGAHHETIRSHQEIANVLKLLGRNEEACNETKLAESKKKDLQDEE